MRTLFRHSQGCSQISLSRVYENLLLGYGKFVKGHMYFLHLGDGKFVDEKG